MSARLLPGPLCVHLCLGALDELTRPLRICEHSLPRPRPEAQLSFLVSEQIRSLLLHSSHVAPWAEATLFAAARAELVAGVIEPALEAGRDVVCDRYIDSSSSTRESRATSAVKRILELNLEATRGLLPDRTILVLVDPEVARPRSRPSDRVEHEGDEFARAVDEAYRGLAAMFSNRIVTVDRSRPAPELAEQIRGLVRELS
jgi:dTMP kinase